MYNKSYQRNKEEYYSNKITSNTMILNLYLIQVWNKNATACGGTYI